MNRLGRDRLLESTKLAMAAIVVGSGTIFAVSQLYGAWSYGTSRARRHGIVSSDGDPEAFWFAVVVAALFLAMVLGGAPFMAWAQSGEMPSKAARPPMRDETKFRKFDP